MLVVFRLTLEPDMVGRDQAIPSRTELAKDATPASGYPIGMDRSNKS